MKRKQKKKEKKKTRKARKVKTRKDSESSLLRMVLLVEDEKQSEKFRATANVFFPRNVPTAACWTQHIVSVVVRCVACVVTHTERLCCDKDWTSIGYG